MICPSPEVVVKPIERIRLHFLLQLLSSKFKVENLTYWFLLLLLLFFQQMNTFLRPKFRRNKEHLRRATNLNCHSLFHVTCGRSSINWTSIEKFYTPSFMLDAVEDKGPPHQTTEWCFCPAFIGLSSLPLQRCAIKYKAPLSTHNVSHMGLNQSTSTGHLLCI